MIFHLVRDDDVVVEKIWCDCCYSGVIQKEGRFSKEELEKLGWSHGTITYRGYETGIDICPDCLMKSVESGDLIDRRGYPVKMRY